VKSPVTARAPAALGKTGPIVKMLTCGADYSAPNIMVDISDWSPDLAHLRDNRKARRARRAINRRQGRK
jgi:hypothetical protein